MVQERLGALLASSFVDLSECDLELLVNRVVFLSQQSMQVIRLAYALDGNPKILGGIPEAFLEIRSDDDEMLASARAVFDVVMCVYDRHDITLGVMGSPRVLIDKSYGSAPPHEEIIDYFSLTAAVETGDREVTVTLEHAIHIFVAEALEGDPYCHERTNSLRLKNKLAPISTRRAMSDSLSSVEMVAPSALREQTKIANLSLGVFSIRADKK